jgi:glutamine amidotransferase
MITIANSGGANLKSVEFALKRMGADYRFAKDGSDLKDAEKILLPGVGSAKNAMELLENNGSAEVIKNTNVPVMGICLGMQLLFEKSSEGDVDCLGVVPGVVSKIKDTSLPIPHMGWNKLEINENSEFDSFENDYVYFVHSFKAEMGDYVKLYSNYGEKIPALIQYKNFWGAQFHPEKSADVGEKILKRFVEL